MASGDVDTDTLVAAVTEPTRRQLLDLLLDRGESTVTALADGLPITRQAVSKHLVLLDRVGLVEARRAGRETRYSVNVEQLDRATRSLGDLAAAWDRRLDRIKRLAEAVHAARGGEAITPPPDAPAPTPRARERRRETGRRPGRPAE